jgi:carboxypeptidase C (cathepsin A)
MRYTRNGHTIFAMLLAISFAAWGQGGRAGRAAAAQQATPNERPTSIQAGRGGRGGDGGAPEFYTYDVTASAGTAVSDAPPAESHGKVAIDGSSLAYTAHAGYLPLRNATTGQAEAHLFYTSYTKDGASDDGARPIVFFLGGAPGVAAAWQEFGGFGPKRMKWMSDGTPGVPPYGWVDNPHTLLGQADLVFVNPVGTAFSRPDQPGKGPSFWNTAADVASLGEFVRGYLNANNRRNSPLFLAGEDFGTGRVAALAAYLHDHQIPVHGVALLSMAVSADAVAGDAQYITLLPSLVMTAWHHKKLAPELTAMTAEQISGQARQFASREYLHALYKGDRMTADERAKVTAGLARLTGLSKAFLVNNDLRVSVERFNSELLRDKRQGLSNSDSRVSGFMPAPIVVGRGGGFGGPAPAAIDFNLSNLSAGFGSAYESYLRRELTFPGNGNGVFYLSGGGVSGFSATATDDVSLTAAFARNPNLRLFVGVNYYDLNTPFYAAEFTIAHLNVSPEVRARRISVSHFEAGQMPYLDNKALAKLQGDLARFVGEAAAPSRN